MPSLSKREIAQQLTGEFNLSLETSIALVDHVFRSIINCLATGRDVELRDYAVFRVVEQKERVGRNPRVPGSEAPIPERFRIKLKPGRLMREAMAQLTTQRGLGQ
jgi:integration host factor subunit beta